MPRPSPCSVYHPARPTTSYGTASCAASVPTAPRRWRQGPPQLGRAVQARRCHPSATLGSGGVLTAEAARAAAKKVLAKVALGEDPQADRTDRRGKDRLTLRALIDEYLAAQAAAAASAQLRRDQTIPNLRDTSNHCTAWHWTPSRARDIAARVVAIVRESGSPTAARARGAISSFFVWCMQMGLVETNPTIGSTKPAESKPRERVLSDDELARIWKFVRRRRFRQDYQAFDSHSMQACRNRRHVLVRDRLRPEHFHDPGGAPRTAERTRCR